MGNREYRIHQHFIYQQSIYTTLYRFERHYYNLLYAFEFYYYYRLIALCFYHNPDHRPLSIPSFDMLTDLIITDHEIEHLNATYPHITAAAGGRREWTEQ